MKKIFRNCQSCGMLFKHGDQEKGTETDGTKSVAYCCNCYENGAFTQPDITAAQMQETIREELSKAGLPTFLANWHTKNIPKLLRWNGKYANQVYNGTAISDRVTT